MFNKQFDPKFASDKQKEKILTTVNYMPQDHRTDTSMYNARKNSYGKAH